MQCFIIFIIIIVCSVFPSLGPFAAFPKALQTGVLDLLYHMDEITPELYNAIALCCHLEGITGRAG